ncbi:OsmC family protein [Alkalitalea saponilacus]|uniref:Putative redox protein n=1 Tax=Alkalitalea saponilacus TaxID=889453 RepID=A0A1T5A1I0_9BACT|nr:OsmC family protein [Alkalitalea saponilacus]ASB48908.1 osmotically inducible protein C [Alkalitalea saponilacus]SKB28881.1 putative redox protein [Alkalitalea saponilacus]
MMNEVKIKWQGNMAFESEMFGHKITLDAAKEVGGEDKGIRPKPLMLLALAGCTGMDVVSMMKKMRVDLEGLEIKVEGDLSEDHPKTYQSMKVIYEFKGKDLPVEKLERAVQLSEEKYCGVSALYKQVIPVTTEVRIVD